MLISQTPPNQHNDLFCAITYLFSIGQNIMTTDHCRVRLLLYDAAEVV